MRNTITLNGVESSTIPGLLIQELPAISKPLMRTEVETIDGRDGDITTDLGFSAYEKQISIGLFGEFDINQVIAYFNSKGTVVFSNEPEKFYNYEIVDQIDFERLVRYRTATVTMHCQPFKYSTTEGADILSTNANFATLNQSLNTDTGFYTYSSNVQDDITATRSGGSGGKFFAVFSVPVVQGVTYYFSGNGSKNISMYGYTNQLRGTSAGISGKGFNGYFTYTATFTGTMVLGFYSNATTEIFIRNFKVSNQSTSTVSGEGTNIVLENSAEAPFSRFDLKGNTEQTTYSGKNLLKFANDSNSDRSAFSYTVETAEKVVATKTTTGGKFLARYEANLESNKTYVFSYGTKPGRWVYVYSDRLWGTNVGRIDLNTSNPTFTPSENQTYILGVYVDGAAGTPFELTNPMIELGTVATSFEPYVGGASPNPEYPQDIKVVAGNQIVKLTAKNLINPDVARSSSNYTESITVNDRNLSALPIQLQPNTQYTVSLDLNGFVLSNGWVLWLTTYSDLIAVLQYQGTAPNYTDRAISEPVTFTTDDSGLVYIAHVYGSSDGRLNTYFDTVKLQLEKGSTATEFEPYRGQSYPISLGSLELCKLGNNVDKPVNIDGAWYIRRSIGKYKFTSSETGSYQSSFPRFSINFSHGQDSTAAVASQALCTHLKVGQTANTNNTFGIGANVIYIRNESCTSLTELNQWFANNDVTVYYALATPIDEEITNETLKAQLEAISQANAYRGRTHIDASAASGNVPHIIAAEVTTDPSGTITNSGNIYSKPKLTIFGSGNVGVYLNGVQMFQIALDTNDYITIDTAIMEAYKDNLQTLKNRSVTGDYNNFKLPVGESEISFSGSVTMCVVENYSRWL